MTCCAICLSSLQNPNTLKDCNHQFHGECIDAWFKKSTTCPICRTQCTRMYLPNTNQVDVTKTETRGSESSVEIAEISWAMSEWLQERRFNLWNSPPPLPYLYLQDATDITSIGGGGIGWDNLNLSNLESRLESQMTRNMLLWSVPHQPLPLYRFMRVPILHFIEPDENTPYSFFHNYRPEWRP
jgi:hypothetical protein